MESTTAATDAVLAVATAVGIAHLIRATPSSPGRYIWLITLAGWGLAAVLGAVTHGTELDPDLELALWQLLYLGLGVAQAMLVVGAVRDWRGYPSARRLLPFMVLTAAGFYWLTRRTGGDFLVFVIYSTATTVFALAVYGHLAARARAGAAWIAAGLAVSLASGAVQASSLSLDLLWSFDHNGLFHLMQMLGLALLVTGLRRSLGVTPSSG
jgi:hypothetical protein